MGHFFVWTIFRLSQPYRTTVQQACCRVLAIGLLTVVACQYFGTDRFDVPVSEAVASPPRYAVAHGTAAMLRGICGRIGLLSG